MRAPIHRAQGQALTEFIAVSLVLVPLLLLPMVAKYQDIAHATQLASRYVAFEAMTRNGGTPAGFKPPAQLADEARRRFFSNPDAAVKTGDTAGDFMAHQNLFWRDQQGGALIRRFGDVEVSFGPSRGAGHENAWEAAGDGLPYTGVRDALGLKADGVYTANISVRIANLPSEPGGLTKAYDELSQIKLGLTRSTSVLIDGWTASGPAQVESRIDHDTLFPGRVLRPLRPIVAAAVAAVEMPQCLPATCSLDMGPRLGELEFWRDTVPADRLQ